MYWSSEDVLLWMSCLVMNGEESGLSVFSVLAVRRCGCPRPVRVCSAMWCRPGASAQAEQGAVTVLWFEFP